MFLSILVPQVVLFFICGPYFLSYLNFDSKTYLIYILAYKFEREKKSKKREREW
jgi:hypothetical protein